jgi:TfoX/Sxy family transcriptional regulator of competence genes
MRKPTPDALVSFDSAFPTDVRAVRKQMFGMPAGFVNGNMFMGVWDDGVLLRLDDDTLSRVRGLPGVGSFAPMEGRAWKDYALVSAGRWGEARELVEWARKALEHTAKMPAKSATPKKGGRGQTRGARAATATATKVASEEAQVMAARKSTAKKKAPAKRKAPARKRSTAKRGTARKAAPKRKAARRKTTAKKK